MILGSSQCRACSKFILLCAFTFVAITNSHEVQAKTTKMAEQDLIRKDLIYVITLHGLVGNIDECDLPKNTAAKLKKTLLVAKDMKPDAVLLDIEGPGGLVSEQLAIIEVLLQAQTEGLRIVALPRNAFSAWALIALSCKEIVVMKTTRMGASVTIQTKGNGIVEAVKDDAVAQKYASVHNASLRQISELTGRSNCIADAMRFQESELWWSPTKGVSANKGPENDWIQLDDKIRVCCLTGSEMVKTKIALGEIDSIKDIPKLLHLNKNAIFKNNEIPYFNYIRTESSSHLFHQWKAARTICKTIRESWGLTAINFNRQLVQRSKLVRDNNGTLTSVYYDTEETYEEFKLRIMNSIRSVKNHLPSISNNFYDRALFDGVKEVHLLLDETLDAVREKSGPAVLERLLLARNLMECLSDLYPK